MKSEEPEFICPALFNITGDKAVRFQRLHFTSLFVVYISLFLASSFAISDMVFGREAASVLYLIFLTTGLVATVIDRVLNLNGVWYANRALAESIKTLSWRYSMCSTPFGINDEFEGKLRILFDELVASHAKYVNQPTTFSEEEKIPLP